MNKRGILRRKSTRKQTKSQSSKTSNTSNGKRKTKAKFAKVGTNAALHGLNKISEYNIPIDKLNNAINILESEKNTFLKEEWQKGCHLPTITRERRFGAHSHTAQSLLAECRECLLNRDWTNLAGLLATVNSLNQESCQYYMRYFIKYALICLLEVGEKDSLDNFLCAVIGCATENEKQVVLKSLVSFTEAEIQHQIDSKEYNLEKSSDENENNV